MLAVYPSGTINKFHIPFSFNAPSRGYRTTTFGHLISSCSVFSESRVPWSNVECYHSSFSPPGQVKGIGWTVIERGQGETLKGFISAGMNAYALGCTDEDLRKELMAMKESGLEIDRMESYHGSTQTKSKILMSEVDECILWLSIVFITILCTPQPTVVRWSSTPSVSDEVLKKWRVFCAVIANAYYIRGMACVITRSLGECRLPVKTLQLEQMAVMGQAEEPSVVASRMPLVFSTLEDTFRRQRKRKFDPAVGRRVSDRAVAGSLFFSPRCVYSSCMFKLMVPGDGGYPSFVVAGFLPGSRGFLRSVDAGSSSREAEARLAPSSSASVSEGACYRRWLLSSDDGATVKREKKRLPVKTLQLEQMAVMGQAEEPSVVASRMPLVFSTLEDTFRRQRKRKFDPAVGRRVSDRAVAGSLFFSPRCVYSSCMFKLMVPGDGGYPSFVVAGFLPGGRGFLRSVDAGSSSREAEARLAPPSSASVSEGACYRRWLLSSDDGATVKREKKRLESRDEISSDG
uniref:DUF7876 domain-containing protein n=1 Tax=Brassica oleracea var. oleracea TaxID=109376 RepID=A0A0D3BWV9_BRAOL